MKRSISGSDFSSGFRLIRNDIFFDFLDNLNTLVLETLFRLSKLVHRNRVSLQPRSKIEILERGCVIFFLL